MKRFLVLMAALCVSAFGQGTSRTYKASQLGAVLDCVPLTGLTSTGGACTNNDTILNTVLATATASKPLVLIMDGGTATSGLLIPATGYVTIDCQNWGNGFFIAAGSNAHVIRNVAGINAGGGANSAPGTAGQNVTIQNCFINGNRGNGTTGDSNSGNARQAANGNWLFGVFLDNMAHVLIDHNWFYDEPSFNLLFNACADCIVSNNRFDAASQALNQDGVHVDGPSAQIRITDNWYNTTDDAIALNAAEGYAGAINGVAMSGNQCVGCITAFRLLANESGAQFNSPVSNITFVNGAGSISNLGSAPGVAFRIGDSSASGGSIDIIRDVKISNSTYSVTDATYGILDVEDNVGELSLSNVTWEAPSSATPFLFVKNSATVSSFKCTACSIYRSTAGSAAAFWASVPSGSTIKRFECSGCTTTNESGQSYGALAYAIDVPSGGLISSLVPGFDPTLTPTLLNGNQWARVTTALGVLTQCGTTSTCGTAAVAYTGGYGKSVIGSAPLVTGTPSTVTISGFPIAFTSTTSFICTVTDQTAAANNLLKVVNTSTSSITITGPVAITDVIGYSCSGN